MILSLQKRKLIRESFSLFYLVLSFLFYEVSMVKLDVSV